MPFGAVADAEVTRGFASIERLDRHRIVTVTGSVDRSVATPDQIIAEFKAWAPTYRAVYPDVKFGLGGEQEQQSEAASGVLKGVGMAMLLISTFIATRDLSSEMPFDRRRSTASDRLY